MRPDLCADVMRRQALAEVMKRKPPGDVRVLDVGTGTGADYARDGSARGAAKRTPRRDLRFQVANAEALPFEAGSFAVVTTVFMLRELPRRVRRSVLLEMRRVLVPGGLLVLMDTAQLSESLELAPALHQFSKDLHEPHFADYLEGRPADAARGLGV